MELTLIEPEKQEQAKITDDDAPAGEQSSAATAGGAIFQFGRFQVLSRQRQLLADGAPIKLGSRAFDILMVLVEADGSLVTKDELVTRAWPRVVVAPDNLKVQICALRDALGEDRSFIRVEPGRGYRFTAAVRSAIASDPVRRAASEMAETPARREPALSMDLAALATQVADLEEKLAELTELLNRQLQRDANRFRRDPLCVRSLTHENREKLTERRRRRSR